MPPHQIVVGYLERKATALVSTDAAFFEQTLHPQFVYVNTRGSRLNKASYIAQFTQANGTKFASQVFRDVVTTGVGATVVATMKVLDTFETSGVPSSHEFQSLCVFIVEGSVCLWLAGQTMLPAGAK